MKKYLKFLLFLLIALPILGLLSLGKLLFKIDKNSDFSLINQAKADIPIIGNPGDCGGSAGPCSDCGTGASSGGGGSESGGGGGGGGGGTGGAY